MAPQRGPGTWELNVSVLNEEIYKNEMELLIIKRGMNLNHYTIYPFVSTG